MANDDLRINGKMQSRAVKAPSDENKADKTKDKQTEIQVGQELVKKESSSSDVELKHTRGNSEQKVAAELAEIDAIAEIPEDSEAKGNAESELAASLFAYADTHSASVGKAEFQEKLKKINKNNVLDVLKQYNSVSPEESLISTILSEIGSSDADMKKALLGNGDGKNSIRGIFILLLDRAKDAGISEDTLKTYKNEFEKELKAQLGDKSFLKQARSLVYTNTEKLDAITIGLIQNIQNMELVTLDEKSAIAAKSPKQLAGEANTILSAKFDKAQSDFTAQLKHDGWAGDVADAFSKIWNNKLYGNQNGNTADMVREDLAKFKNDVEKLNRAAQLGTTTYAREFKKIFGVEFNPLNIAAYKKAEATYMEAIPAKKLEDAVNSELSLLLFNDKLKEEYKTFTASGGIPVTYVSANKEDVYAREYKKLTDMLGEENKALLEQRFKNEKAETIDDKYKILHQVAKSLSESLAQNTKIKSGGKDFKDAQKTYEASYKAAFGLENDIAKRVNDYNVSQQRGAGAVKSAAVIGAMTAVSIATMGMGTPVVMGASVATAAGATAVAEVSDRFTSGAALDELKDKGVLEYLKKGSEMTDWSGVAKASATSAGMTLLFMGQSYAVTNLCKAAGMSATTGAIVNSASFIGTGLGTEYLMTGEISVQGATFTVLLAVVGGAIQVKQIQKMEAATAAQQEAKLGTDIQNARQTLGFDNDTPITAEQLKSQYRKLAAQNHPDAGGSDIAMATINSAHDVLKNNMARINDFIGKVIQPPVAPNASAQGTAHATTQAAAAQSAVKTTSLSTCVLPKTMPVQTGTVGTIPVRVAIGDLTAVKADAYMVPQFDSCSSEGGVGGAIWSRGAQKGMEAYNAHIDANGKQEFGSVVVTESGGGNSSKLLHAVTVGSGRESAFETVQKAVYNALKAAEKEGIHSVAIPEIGTGIIGELSGEQSAQAIMSGINKFSDYGGKMDVSLVIYGSQKDFNTFVSTMNDKTYANATPTTGTREFDAGRWVAEMTNPGSTTAEVSTPATAKSMPAKAEVSVREFTDELMSIKTPDGERVLSDKDIDNIILNSTNAKGEPIPNYQAKIRAILANPEEVEHAIMWAKPGQRAIDIVKAIGEPLPSTVKANPELFGSKSAISSMFVTRPNGMQVDVLANIPKATLASPTAEHLHLPAATTVDDGFGIVITQAKASPVEAKRIIFADTVEETLRINNEHGIPLKYEANPPKGEQPYFYKDAPYGGRQKVNTQSVEVTYTHEATADWGLTPEYVAEYADAKGMCPDRAVVAAGDDPVTGLKGNIAEKQYEIVNPDGSRSPLVVGDLKPGQMVQIIKKEGVELKMAVFDKPTVSLEGETLPAGKLMMIDSEGHPYNGNPVKRLRSGEVQMAFDKSDPAQVKMSDDLAKIKDLDAQTKSAKKSGNKELAGQLKTQADALAKELDADLTKFVMANQLKNVPTHPAKIVASVPKSMTQISARINHPVKSDNLLIQELEKGLSINPHDIETARYVEFTGVNTPQSRFTVYEPNASGKFVLVQASNMPDGTITNMGGIYDMFYDAEGNKVAQNLYNSKTRVIEETTVSTKDGFIRKEFNPDGSVKGYTVNRGTDLPVISYDADGNITEIYRQIINIDGKKVSIDVSRQPDAMSDESTWETVDGITIVKFRHGKYNYVADTDPVRGLININRTGKATPPKTQLSPQKAELLAKAGFTEEVIGDLKLESSRTETFIDEVLDMVEYLETEVQKGKPVTAKLINSAIAKFAPEASGNSAAAQRYILANNWIRGAEVYKAYGQEPPAKIVAKLNAVKAPAAASMFVTRPNGMQVDVLANIPKATLLSPTAEHLHLPAATTVDDGFGIIITQAKASPVEAKRIIFADTVEETLRINNEHGIPLKYEANPPKGEQPYFYKDAPYGGRQKVNTQSVEVTYTHEATADWGLTPEYVAEYADAKGMCPDRAVVAAGDDPVTGLKGNIAEKQYEIVNPDGSRSPLVVGDLKPGQMVQIIKKEGVELKMAVFDKPTVSLEGETLPAGKLMMIDSEGHPYNGNPVKRLRSGEVQMAFDKSDPAQAKMSDDLAKIKDLDAQTKSAKKSGNKELAGQLKTQADALAKELDADLTKFVMANQ